MSDDRPHRSLKDVRARGVFRDARLARLDATETWKRIPEFENYEASSWGRVRYAGPRTRGTHPGRLLKLNENPEWGYLSVRLRRDGRPTTVMVQAAVAAAFIGGRPRTSPTARVAHIDGDKTNNRVSNLRWARQQQIRKGRFAGESARV